MTPAPAIEPLPPGVSAAPAAVAAASGSTSLLGLYRLVWRYAKGARCRYLAAMALLAGASTVKLVIPVLAGLAINSVQRAGEGSILQAGLLIFAVIVVQAISWGLHGPGRILERHVGVRVRTAAADALFVKLVSLPLSWHEQHHSGELQHRAQQATHALYDFTQNQFIYVQNAINLVGPLVALLLISKLTGALAFAGFVTLAIVIVRFDRALMRLAVLENSAERSYTAGLLDVLGNVSTIISLRVGEASRRLVDARLQKVFAPLGRSIVLNEGKWCAVDLLSVGLSWLLVGAYAWQAHRPQANGGTAILLGSVFMVYQYAQQAAAVITSMASNFQNFARVKTDVASADPIWKAASAKPSSVSIAPDWKRIDARGLDFTYERGNRSGGVKEVSLSFGRGERIALIGPSGSGKSTLLRLIAGLYDPQHGYYKVDGDTVFGARNLGTIATLIPQEAEVFEASVRENLTFGAERSLEAIQRAAQLSAFDSVLASLPQGVETPLSERGFNFSGGQRQRLALARGLLAAGVCGERGSSMLLLDEPTSALDQATEARVFERLRANLPDTCIVASVHRLSVLEHFDRVVLMSEGAIVDSGTVRELYARQPLFREMLRKAGEDGPVAPLPPSLAAV